MKSTGKYNPKSRHLTSILEYSIASGMADSLQPYGALPAKLLCPWDSPGKNTGVGTRGICLTQGLRLHLWCIGRRSLYHQCHWGLLLLLLSRFSRVQLLRPHRRQPTRLPRPWDSPGKNTGVGCHFLLQCMKVKSESEVPQPCPTLHDPMDCSLPGSSAHGIFQARVLEWGAIAFSLGTSRSRYFLR